MARAVADNYFTDFVDEKGMINMRGPETAQFGMTLPLLARYYNYDRGWGAVAQTSPQDRSDRSFAFRST